MASTLLLDASSWDLVLDSSGNIAVASEPYSLAQDAASAIQTYLGEVFFDTTVGVPWLQSIFGASPPPISLIKEKLVNAALTVPDVAGAAVFITSLTNRGITGQVQVRQAKTGLVSAASFSVTNLQGVG